MPKASTIQKSKFISDEYIWNPNDSRSVDLFAACGSVPVDDNSNSFSWSEQKARQKSKKEKRHGAQSIHEKSRCDNESSEKDRNVSSDKRARRKKDVQSSIHEDNPIDGKGISDKGTSKENIRGRRKVLEGKKVNDCSGDEIGESKQTTQRVSGKRSKREGRTDVTLKPVVDYKDFKLVEFDDSSILLPPKTIQYGPFDTESELDVYIVIDDIRYRVSKCSIRNNVYVQGLDSRFLVTHYKLNKKS